MPAEEDIPFDYDAAVLACARGERFALRVLYEREVRRLLGVALRILRDRARAEDVLQDAFVQIWQQAPGFRPELGSARGWIHTVVRHRALMELRQSRQAAPADMPPALVGDPANHDFDSEALERCLQLLDEGPRDGLLLAFIEGFTHEQIARRSGAPLATVKSRVRRGLASLKECLA